MKKETLITILTRNKSVTNTGITFIDRVDTEIFLSYKELYVMATAILGELQSKGLKKRNELVFQTDDNFTFITVFWACILGGIVPVPLSTGQTDDHRQKLYNIWPYLNEPYVLTSEKNLNRIKKFAETNQLNEVFAEMVNKSIIETDLFSGDKIAEPVSVKEDEIAFIQFSSGSTGTPKGVVLTHKNVITNVRSINNASMYTDKDSMMSWMPLTHDMGLIGFHINPLFCGINQYIISTQLFIRNPLLWMEKVSKHKVTVLSSPNFGYSYFLKYARQPHHYQWDLSSVRIIYNGAEPISASLCDNFIAYLSPYKFPKYAMRPVYGLAEGSVAITISIPGAAITTITVDRDNLNIGDTIKEEGRKSDITFISLGKEIDCCHIRVTDHNDKEVTEGIVGHIQIKGSNVTTGYYNNPVATEKVFTADGWLKTGDVGLTKNGELYITGREKDIIWVNGKNYYGHDLEQLAESVDSIELNQIIICGCFNDLSGQDEAIAFVLYRGDMQSFMPIRLALKAYISKMAGVELANILPVKSLPKTTSGKLQRFKIVEYYRRGDFDQVSDHIASLENSLKNDLPSADKPIDINEERLLRIWEKLLGKGPLSMTQNFFEAGVTSLKLTEAAMAINKEFAVDIPVELLIEKNTVRALSEQLVKLNKNSSYRPIPKAPPNKLSPLSSSQLGIYQAWEMDKDSIAYNLPAAFRFNGALEVEKLKNCIKQLIHRHNILRASYALKTDAHFTISENIDLTISSFTISRDELNDQLKSSVKPFNLATGPLYRFSVFTMEVNEHVLFFDFHHIISDGLSVRNFLVELWELYNDNVLPEQNIQYQDYVFWEQSRLLCDDSAADDAYWQEKLKQNIPVTDLPVDFKRPVVFKTLGRKLEFLLDEVRVNKLKQFAASNNCTLHVLLAAVYGMMLAKYTGREDIIFGIPVANRPHHDLQPLQGMFVNNLTVVSRIDGNESFLKVLATYKKNIKEALAHQNYPFQYQVEKSNRIRDISRHPLFDTMFIYQNMSLPKLNNEYLEVSRLFFDPGFSKYDFSIEFFEQTGSMPYYIEYATSLFEKNTILGLQKYFENLIDALLENHDRTISEISAYNAAEVNPHISSNKVDVTNCNYQTIHEWFDQQATLNPGKIAAEFENQHITYGDLASRSEQLATILQQRIISGSAIGVNMGRSIELIVSMLGILKAGCSFVPIDANLPRQRKHFILEQSKCSALVINSKDDNFNSSSPHDLDINIIDISSISKNIDEGHYLKKTAQENNIAYVIFTSGSTGAPKGVSVGHKSLLNYIAWAAETYVKSEELSFPLFTSTAFDLTITSIFLPLVTGNKIIIYKDSETTLSLEKVISDNKSDIIKLTPSHLKIALDNSYFDNAKSSKIKQLILGGEQLSTRLAKRVYEKFEGGVEIYNEYGPTEATVGCMIALFDPEKNDKSVPIGFPIINTNVYLLDKFMKPVPPGVTGELYISGACLALGYVNDKMLTASKFLPDPFLKGGIIYKTGDEAKILKTGELAYIGRIDRQVKISGYRIELAEIEQQLTAFEKLADVAVAIKTDARNNQILCAYYTGNKTDEAELRNFLAKSIPHYMIPSHFVKLERIPLTTNAKVDYDALPFPERSTREAVINDINDPLELLLVETFKNVFRKNEISVFDNFFDIGGDSIKAIQIVSRMADRGIALTAKDIFACQTIREIRKVAIAASIETIDLPPLAGGIKELTPIEDWFFGQQFKAPGQYNQSISLKLKRPLTIPLLNRAFDILIRHHDGLRLNYSAGNGKMFYNEVHLNKTFDTAEFFADPQSDLLSQLFAGRVYDFDIAKELLFKAALVQAGDQGCVLLITMHHLIIDGVSWRILLNDLLECFRGLEKDLQYVFNSKKTASLAQWANSLQTYDISEGIKYWNKANFSEFDIQTDFETSDWSVKHLRQFSATIEAAKTELLLKGVHAPFKTDVPIILNTALALTLQEITGMNELIIEQESHGRHLDTPDVSNTIGWFTIMYPQHLKITATSLDHQIIEVKHQIKEAADHRLAYGIAALQKRLPKRKGIAEIRFNYLGQFGSEVENDFFALIDEDLSAYTGPENNITAKIEINCMIINGQFKWALGYNSLAHNESTIDQLTACFFKHLDTIIEYLSGEKEIRLSPSDFKEVVLSVDDLNELFN